MTLTTVKQLADGVLALLFTAAALSQIVIVMFFGLWDAWQLYLGFVWFGVMAMMCVRDLVKRRRANAR